MEPPFYLCRDLDTMEDIAEELDSEGEEEEEGLSVDATNGKVSFTKGGSAEEDRGRAGEASGGAETLSSPTPPSSPPPPPPHLPPHPLRLYRSYEK